MELVSLLSEEFSVGNMLPQVPLHIRSKTEIFFDDGTEDLDDILEGTKEPLYPVYIMLIHSGTALSTIIKAVTHSQFSHSSISFDDSMTRMYSFGRKLDANPFIGGFKVENIQNPFFRGKDIPYALYAVFCTKSQIAAMKKRLDYFIQNDSKFKYDFTGLFKNYIGVADNPEYKWFCSRFVSDIINAGSITSDPMIKNPSLVRPEDFTKMPFTVYITGGTLDEYSPTKVRSITKKIVANYQPIAESSIQEYNEGVTQMSSNNMLSQMFYEFFHEMLDGEDYLLEKSDDNVRAVPDEIEPIVKILEGKGYRVKYASPGYVDGRFANDANKDGVINSKMVSTGRIIFEKDYKFPSTPKRWGWKFLRNGFKALYVKPFANDYDKPTSENIRKWHDEYIDSIKTWAESLPTRGTIEDEELKTDKNFGMAKSDTEEK